MQQEETVWGCVELRDAAAASAGRALRRARRRERCARTGRLRGIEVGPKNWTTS